MTCPTCDERAATVLVDGIGPRCMTCTAALARAWKVRQKREETSKR